MDNSLSEKNEVSINLVFDFPEDEISRIKKGLNLDFIDKEKLDNDFFDLFLDYIFSYIGNLSEEESHYTMKEIKKSINSNGKNIIEILWDELILDLLERQIIIIEDWLNSNNTEKSLIIFLLKKTFNSLDKELLSHLWVKKFLETLINFKKELPQKDKKHLTPLVLNKISNSKYVENWGIRDKIASILLNIFDTSTEEWVQEIINKVIQSIIIKATALKEDEIITQLSQETSETSDKLIDILPTSKIQ